MSWPFLAAQGCDHTVLPQDCLSAKINLIPYNTVEGLGMVTPLARAAGKISIQRHRRAGLRAGENRAT